MQLASSARPIAPKASTAVAKEAYHRDARQTVGIGGAGDSVRRSVLFGHSQAC